MFRPIEEHLTDRGLADAKRRQQLRQTRPELRQLESQLRLAYVEKERSAQRAEKRLETLQRQREVEEERRKDEEVMKAWETQERLQDQQREVEKIRYQRQLDYQLEEKQSERYKALNDFLAEKREVDIVIEKVKRERREAALEEIVKRETEKHSVREFIEAQKVFARFEKEQVEEENKKITKFLGEKEEWIRHQKEMEAMRKANKSDTIFKLAEEIQRQHHEELEREAIMHELLEGRQRDAARQKELLDMEAEIRRKMLVRESNEVAVGIKQRKILMEKQEEEEWKIKMMEEFAEADRLDQLSNERRRRKQAEHRRDVELLVESKREAKMREDQKEVDFWREHRLQEQAMDRVVEEERMKLLRAHASKLIGFLPGGLIQEKDLDYLGEDVRKSFRVRGPPRDPLKDLEDLYITKDRKPFD